MQLIQRKQNICEDECRTLKAMSESVHVGTAIVLSTLVVVGVLGNSLVCVVITKNRDMRVPVNYLLVNLAVADIMYASFITPQYILGHTFTHPDGVSGTLLCRLLTGGNFAWVGAASSVFTLANISIERYYAVMYPLGNKGKLTERKLMVFIPSAWIFSVIVNIPIFLVVNFENESGTCAREWPEKWMPRAYNVAWFVILAVIPLTLMAVFYSRVVYTLWFKQIDGSALTHKQKGVLRVRKRVTLAVVVVSVIFGICWITDSIVYIVSHFNTDSFGAAVYSISNTMIMFNSAVNPFVYALLNQRFREKIKSTITCKASSRARVHPARSEPLP